MRLISLGIAYSIATVIILLPSMSGCEYPTDSPDRKQLRRAIKQLAPEGGSGVKRYHYTTGKLKEAVFWDGYEIGKIEYYDRNGRRLYTAIPNGRYSLVMSLDDDGRITEICQTKDFIKDGHCFVFEDESLTKIEILDYGGVVGEVLIRPRASDEGVSESVRE